MDILEINSNLLVMTTKEDNDVILYAENLKVVIKHNNTGLSLDYYRNVEEEPFRMDQVEFAD
jgi:hypothetical protein